jgi:hypothetical protein
MASDCPLDASDIPSTSAKNPLSLAALCVLRMKGRVKMGEAPEAQGIAPPASHEHPPAMVAWMVIV